MELMHPALLTASGWRYAGRARELMAARWGHVLGAFDDLPKHRRTDIVALYEVAWRMDAVNAWESAERARRRAKRRKKRG